MSDKRFKKMLEAREHEKCCTTTFKVPVEICAITMIAVCAIAWIGTIGLKREGGKLPWEQ